MLIAEVSKKFAISQDIPDTQKSCFFSHSDPEMVKWLGTAKFDI